MPNFTRTPKLLGDFGEGFVTYTLIRKGHEVAYVDHVGADLISSYKTKNYAISVKTRFFKEGSTESRMITIKYSDLEKLEFFSKLFNLTPLFSAVICLADDRKTYVIITTFERIKEKLNKTKNGYSLSFANRNLEKLISDFDVTIWADKGFIAREY